MSFFATQPTSSQSHSSSSSKRVESCKVSANGFTEETVPRPYPAMQRCPADMLVRELAIVIESREMYVFISI